MIKPFLKWAGGKSRLSDKISGSLIIGDRLIEPFVGSGAIFINTEYKRYYLADTNSDLINLYNHLKNEGEHFIDFAEQYFTQKNNTEEQYYNLREKFNSSTDTRFRSAVFIYLNRHCFNGLCRYNKKGIFNVPFGKYSSPYFPRKEMLFFYEKSKYAIFETSDFRKTMKLAQKGDMVYCDPPYVPLTETANFTSYSIDGFDMNDQADLLELAKELKNNGIPVLISNHNTDWTRDNYNSFIIQEFDVRRFISSNAKNRQKASELLALFN